MSNNTEHREPIGFEGDKGEWVCHTDRRSTRMTQDLYEIHYSTDGECSAEIVHGKPNAQLIAQSKNMAVALQEYVSTCEHSRLLVDDPDSIEQFIDKAKNILKAAGVQHENF